MFFPSRITRIKPGALVLEIGPGMQPHPKSNVFLERRYTDEQEFVRQTGGALGVKPRSNVVMYDGNRFPFSDGAFDYVICSHVIEHVSDVEYFLQEMFRVARAGYIEYPTVLYEYLYNFEVHENLLLTRGNILAYMPKGEVPLSEFRPIQKFFHRALDLGYSQLVDALADKMFQGFEWSGSFDYRRAAGIEELVPRGDDLVPWQAPPPHEDGRLRSRVWSRVGSWILRRFRT